MTPENYISRELESVKKNTHTHTHTHTHTVAIIELNNKTIVIKSSVDEFNTRKDRTKEVNSKLDNRAIENT